MIPLSTSVAHGLNSHPSLTSIGDAINKSRLICHLNRGNIKAIQSFPPFAEN